MKKKNKLFPYIGTLLVVFCALCLSSCFNNEDDPIYENLKELKVSNNTLSMEYGTSVNVNIESGNGGYVVSVDDQDMVEATLNSTTITIRALKAGNAKVYVEDQKGKKQEIAVTIAEPVNIETDEFITVWKTDNEGTSNSTSITLPVSGSYTVSWAEVGKSSHKGTTEYSDITPKNFPTIDFGSVGMYRIRIKPKDENYPFSFMFDTYSEPILDGLKLIRVERWGTNKWPSAASMFAQCKNMDVTATDVPDFSKCDGKIYNMFFHCENLVGNDSFGKWDVSKMWHMNEMFAYCYKFNQNLNAWNTAAGYLMSAVFKGCSVFNQPLSNWKVDNASNLSGFFDGANSFNQDISSWNVSNAENLLEMFKNASAFNQNLGKWTLVKATNVENMFNGCGMKSVNYDATLNGWAANSKLPESLKLGAEGLVYSAQGKEAHSTLTDTKKWTITGDSYVEKGN